MAFHHKGGAQKGAGPGGAWIISKVIPNQKSFLENILEQEEEALVDRQEQEYHANKPNKQKQKCLTDLQENGKSPEATLNQSDRREKVDQENTLEQEQKALINRQEQECIANKPNKEVQECLKDPQDIAKSPEPSKKHYWLM